MIEQERGANTDAPPPFDSPAENASSADHGRNRRWRRWGGPRGVIVTLIAILIAAAMVYRLWPQQAAEEEAEAVIVSVQTAKAEVQSLAEQSAALGTIFPKQQATISAKISAPIAKMELLKNRVVAAGAPLAVLESRDLQAQRTEAAAAVEEARGALQGLSSGAIPQGNAMAEKDLRDAQAMVENTRAILERRRILFERGGISKKELEAAQLAFTTAEDQLRLAESTVMLRRVAINPNDRAQAESKIRQAEERLANLTAQVSYATILAPFTGVITDQFQYKGEFAAAGAKLLTIADLSEVIVKAPFPDTVAAQLQVGDEATVNPTDLPGEQFHGRISLVSRASDPTNRTVEVWVNLENRKGRLRANGAAQVIVATKVVAAALVVPAAAVTLDASNANEGKVMVVDDKSIAHETKVVIGVRTPERIEIISGLKGGETVVVEGAYALPDGAKVQVNEPEKEGDEKDDKAPKEEPEQKQEKKGTDAPSDGDAKPKPGAKS
jgi:HlyD family secretion protein